MSIREALKDLGYTMTGDICEGNNTKAVLKSLCKNLTGKDSAGKSIAEVVKDIDNNYPDKITVDTNIPANESLFGKTVDKLQENVFIKDGKVYGKLFYLTDYTQYSESPELQVGNFLALHATANNDEVIAVSMKNGFSEPRNLDSDGLVVFRIADKDTQTVKFTNKGKTVEFDLTNLVCEPAPTE